MDSVAAGGSAAAVPELAFAARSARHKSSPPISATRKSRVLSVAREKGPFRELARPCRGSSSASDFSSFFQQRHRDTGDGRKRKRCRARKRERKERPFSPPSRRSLVSPPMRPSGSDPRARVRGERKRKSGVSGQEQGGEGAWRRPEGKKEGSRLSSSLFFPLWQSISTRPPPPRERKLRRAQLSPLRADGSRTLSTTQRQMTHMLFCFWFAAGESGKGEG